MIRQTVFALGLSTLVSLTAGAAAYAQEQTPPKTSVRNLEAPTDVRRKQLHGSHAMRHHVMMHRHRFARRGAPDATMERGQ